MMLEDVFPAKEPGLCSVLPLAMQCSLWSYNFNWNFSSPVNSNFRVHQNHLEDLSKHTFFGFTLEFLSQCISDSMWKPAPLADSQAMLMLQVLGSHFKGKLLQYMMSLWRILHVMSLLSQVLEIKYKKILNNFSLLSFFFLIFFLFCFPLFPSVISCLPSSVPREHFPAVQIMSVLGMEELVSIHSWALDPEIEDS